MSRLPGPIKHMPDTVQLELVTMRCEELEAEIASLQAENAELKAQVANDDQAFDNATEINDCLRAENERLKELACDRHISEALESGQLMKMKAELEELEAAFALKNAALDLLEFLEPDTGISIEECPACGWPRYGMNGRHAPDCRWQAARRAGHK